MLLHLFHSNIFKTIQLQVQFGLQLIQLRSFIWQRHQVEHFSRSCGCALYHIWICFNTWTSNLWL